MAAPRIIPDIGCMVNRPSGPDAVAQIRIDHGTPGKPDHLIEQAVLVWCSTRERFKPGDEWSERVLTWPI